MVAGMCMRAAGAPFCTVETGLRPTEERGGGRETGLRPTEERERGGGPQTGECALSEGVYLYHQYLLEDTPANTALLKGLVISTRTRFAGHTAETGTQSADDN